MISIELGSLENAMAFTKKIKLFVLAESLGGVESLVSDGLPEIMVDETQIVQVLTNLLTNASQAIAEAGVGDKTTLRSDLVDGGQALRLVVEDNGPGIPADIADKIFDPLFTTKSAGKGMGVGLALCNRIIASHGGTISLNQNAGTGACFTIDLPMTKAQTEG